MRHIDAPVVRFRDGNTDGDLEDEGDDTLYYANDANMNVTALVDSGGNVVERYAYDPYGQPAVLDADWSADADGASDVGNDILYCGYRLDSETGLYHVRHRYLHPTFGRWLSRDPLGALVVLANSFQAKFVERVRERLRSLLLSDRERVLYGRSQRSPERQMLQYLNGDVADVGGHFGLPDELAHIPDAMLPYGVGASLYEYLNTQPMLYRDPCGYGLLRDLGRAIWEAIKYIVPGSEASGAAEIAAKSFPVVAGASYRNCVMKALAEGRDPRCDGKCSWLKAATFGLNTLDPIERTSLEEFQGEHPDVPRIVK